MHEYGLDSTCVALHCAVLHCIAVHWWYIGLDWIKSQSLYKLEQNLIQFNSIKYQCNSIKCNAIKSNQIKSNQIKSKSYLVIYQSLGGSSFVQYLSKNWVASTSSVSSYSIWALVTLVSTHSASFISPIQSNHANIPSHPSITLFVMKWSYTYTLYSSQCNIHQCLTRVELTANFLAT